jgi:hypothetical protein
MADIKRKGYGQVEPNHLSGIVTGQIYAQLPAMTITTTGSGESAVTTKTPMNQLEQGQFAKYDYAAGAVDFTGEGEFMLVYNEEKLYDERKQSHKDFVYKATDFTDGKMFPRLIRTYIGDIFTTNMIGAANTADSETDVTIGTDATLVVGAYVAPNANTGILTVSANKPASGMAWKIVKVYTMPDGQFGVKIQRVQ